MNKQNGITMVEVLIALAITAIALSAGSKAMKTLITGTDRQEKVVLAQLCAENSLFDARMKSQFPPIGQSSIECEQMGLRFDVTRFVSATANPSFRRVQAQVSLDGHSVISIATVVGRY